VEEMLHTDAKENASRGASEVSVPPEEQSLREFNVQLSATFVQQWQKHFHGDEHTELSDEAAATNMVEGLKVAKEWDRFWKEAQEDIDLSLIHI